MDMKRVSHKRGCLHVETPLGIFNIYVGLINRRGQRVECVELIGSQCSGELVVKAYERRLVELKTVKG